MNETLQVIFFNEISKELRRAWIPETTNTFAVRKSLPHLSREDSQLQSRLVISQLNALLLLLPNNYRQHTFHCSPEQCEIIQAKKIFASSLSAKSPVRSKPQIHADPSLESSYEEKSSNYSDLNPEIPAVTCNLIFV